MENTHRIERYLRKEMSPEERSRFLEQVQASPDLAQELAFQENLFRELGNSEKRRFADTLYTISDDFFGPSSGSTSAVSLPDVPSGGPDALAPGAGSGGRFALYSLIAVGIAGLLWYAWSSTASVSEVQHQQTSIPPSAPAAPNSSGVAVVVAPPTDKNATSTATPPAAAAAPDAAATPGAPRAAVAPVQETGTYLPNAHWEQLAGRQLLNGERHIQAKANVKGNNTLNLSLDLRWPAREVPGALQVAFYSNAGADRVAGKPPLRTVDLELLQSLSNEEDAVGNKKYNMTYSTTISWPRGLYYFVITRAGSPEPIYVGKLRF